MVIREAYNTYSDSIRFAFDSWRDNVCGAFASYYLGQQNAMNSLQSSPIGVVFLPLTTVYLWFLAGINYILQQSLLLVSILVNNLDFVNYSILSVFYILVMFVIIFRIVGNTLMQILLIQPPFLILAVFAVLTLRGEPTPIITTREVCLDFLDYWFINYEISIYVGFVLSAFFCGFQFGFISNMLAGGILAKLFLLGICALILAPVFIALYEMLTSGLSLFQAIDEARVTTKSILRIQS